MHFNFIWVLIEKVGASLLSIGAFFLYAYLLAPEDLGTAIIVLSITQFFAILIGTIFEDALVQMKQLSADCINTAFSTGLLISVVCMALIQLGFYVWYPVDGGYQVLAMVAFANLEILVINASVVFVAQLRRDGQFKLLALRIVGGRIGGALAGIIAALCGAGAWAIVVQSVVAATLQFFIILYKVPALPRLCLSLNLLPYFFDFGAKLALTRLSWDLLVRAAPILGGITLGTAAAGHIGFAWRMMDLFKSAIVSGLMSYLLPHYSRLQSSKPTLVGDLTSSSRIVAFFVTPLFLGLFVTAPALVAGIFEEKWMASVPLIQMYCLAALIWCYRAPHNIAMTACGFPGIVLKEELSLSIVCVVAMWFSGSYGLWIFSAVFIANALVMLPVGVLATRRVLNLSWRDQLAPVFHFALPGFAMSVALFSMIEFFSDSVWVNYLLFQIMFGVLAFSCFAFIFYRQEINIWLAGLKKTS